MTKEKFNLPDLNDAEKNIKDLLKNVTSTDSELAGGTQEELTRGITAVQRLKETKVTFGKPIPIALTKEAFKAKKLNLTSDIEDLMNDFDFYSMKIIVDPITEPSVLISRLECNLDFGPKGEDEPEYDLKDIKEVNPEYERDCCN